MIKPEMVPEAAFKAAHHKWLDPNSTWDEVVAAALNAWPEAKRVKGYFTHDTDYYEPAFILPLPTQENEND